MKIEQKGIADGIARSFDQDRMEPVGDVLREYKDDHSVWTKAHTDPSVLCDPLEVIYRDLPERHRRLFCILANRHIEIHRFQHRQAHHPFLDIAAAEINLDLSEAVTYLSELYASGQKRGFAIALWHYLRPLKWSLVEALSEDPRFNRHISIVDTPDDRTPFVTPLLLLVSNEDVPSELEIEDSVERGDWDVSNPPDDLLKGFEVISSSNEIFSTLAGATQAALSDLPASRGFGPYAGNAPTSLNYESTIALHAAVLKLIKDRPNFFYAAARRADAQRNHCSGLYHGGLFGKRFLKDQGYPAWAQALWNKWLPKGSPDELIEETAYQLTKYGLSEALRVSHVGLSDKASDVFCRGFIRAMEEMQHSMQSLSRFQDGDCEALDRYRETFGFHKDVDVLTLPEQKKAAYADLSDYFTAGFFFNQLAKSFFGDDIEGGYRLRDHIPYAEAFENFLDTHNFTAAFRVLNYFEHRDEEVWKKLNRTSRDFGVDFVEMTGLKLSYPGEGPNGHAFVFCLDRTIPGSEAMFVMPPTLEPYFIKTDDLKLTNAVSTSDAQTIDYTLKALTELGKSRVANSTLKLFLADLVVATGARVKDELRVSIDGLGGRFKELGDYVEQLEVTPENGSFYPVVSRTSELLQSIKREATKLGLIEPTLVEKPRFWRAARLLDRVGETISAYTGLRSS